MSKLDLRVGRNVTNDVWEQSISQENEDVVIKKIIQEINISDKVGVDVGSWDGKHYSNIYNLLTLDDWGGILIEGNTVEVNDSIERFKDRSDIHTHEAWVDREDNNINSILSKYNCPQNFGVFNLDIDSIDYWVWKDLTYTPEIVCVEHNGNIVDEDKVLKYSKSWVYSGSRDDYGASAKSLLRLGNHKGYKLVSVTDSNLIFVKNEVADKFVIIDEINPEWCRNECGVHNSGRQKMSNDYFTVNPEVD